MKNRFLPAVPGRDESRFAPLPSSWAGVLLGLVAPRHFRPDLEQTYRAWRNERALDSARAVLLTATLAFLGFAAWDHMVAPHQFTRLLPIRALYSAGALALWFATRFKPFQKRLNLVLGSAALGAITGITWILNIVPNGWILGIMGYAYPQMALMVMPGARIVAWNCAAMLLLVNIVLFRHAVVGEAWVNTNFALCFLGVLTYTFAFINEVRDRRIFELEQDLERLASLDSLSGAWNRRHFAHIAEAEVARARRYGHPLALLLLDVDHFKKINDTFGHAAGDDAIRALAATCRQTLRASDSLGRLGGEEFMVLLPETDLEAARVLAERLREAIGLLQLQSDLPQGLLSFSASLGVALAGEDETFEKLLQQADAALYKAKDAGRNRVVVTGNR